MKGWVWAQWEAPFHHRRRSRRARRRGGRGSPQRQGRM